MTEQPLQLTLEEIGLLACYQAGDRMRPYTCGVDHAEGHARLIPTQNGWVCALQDCDYTQQYREADIRLAGAQRELFRP